MGVYVYGFILSTLGAIVPCSGLPDLGKECSGSPRGQRNGTRAQRRARIRVSVDAFGRDILDHWRAADGGLMDCGGIRDSSVASGVGGVDFGADAGVMHDVWDRLLVGLRRRRTSLVGVDVVCGGAAMQTDGGIISVCHAGDGLLSATAV